MAEIITALERLLETPLTRMMELSIGQALALALICGVLARLCRR